MSNGGYNQAFTFGGTNMSSSFNMGGSAFGEDELLESLNNTQDYGAVPNGNHGVNIHQGPMNGMYSNTPDGAPIQSPFVGNFDYNQFRPMNSIPQHMSPHQNSPYMSSGKRPSMQAQHRKSSAENRHPMTPRTHAMAGLHIGTPDVGSMQQNGCAIRAPNSSNRHRKTMSGQFDGTPGSLHSIDSPLSSPSYMTHHNG